MMAHPGHVNPNHQLPEDVQQATGFRYSTNCELYHGGATGYGRLLLCGNEPFTADTVHAAVAARGYAVTSVRPVGYRWRAELSEVTYPDEYRLVVFRSGWHTVCTAHDVILNPYTGTWSHWWRRESIEDEDRYLFMDRALTERVTRAFGTELPDERYLTAIHEAAWRRMAQHHARDEALYARREEQFAADRERLAAHATRLTPVSGPPGVKPPEAYRTVPLTLQLGEPFPLINPSHGGLGQKADLLAHRIVLGEMATSLQLWLPYLPLEYLAVTPFCPAEGYQIDEGDLDPERRDGKLADSPWGHVVQPHRMFPASPRRLNVFADHDNRDLWLELRFPDGSRWLAGPEDDPSSGMPFRYRRWVPAGIGPLAVVSWLGPEWVSINVPAHTDLLREVTATFHEMPGRRHPGPPGYEER